MGLYFVPIKDIPDVWNEVEPFIDKTIDRTNNYVSTSEYLINLTSGTTDLCIGLDRKFSGDFKELKKGDIKMVLVCDTVTYTRVKILHINIWATKTGHDYGHWMKQFETIENFGRDHGCSVVTALTRRGLAKKLKSISNWTEQSILLTKQL